MIGEFFRVLHSEWLKKRRSSAAWLMAVGAFFTPAIVVAVRMMHRDRLSALYVSDTFWTDLWKSSCESMAIFFLPMAVILATSLAAQIEYRNNAWKQVHALPLRLVTIYLAKLAVVMLMLAQFVALFVLGVWLSAMLPPLFSPGVVPYPSAPTPWRFFLADGTLYFVDCLPIVAAQYLLSLRFGNFLVPIGIGFLVWVGTLAALSSKYVDLIPYAYSMLHYLKAYADSRVIAVGGDTRIFALAYFALFVVVGYGLQAFKAEKG